MGAFRMDAGFAVQALDFACVTSTAVVSSAAERRVAAIAASSGVDLFALVQSTPVVADSIER